jgi:hypothetical protein
MRIIFDEVDGAIYGDIIISSKELQRMKFGEMVDGLGIHQYRRFYLGVRLQGAYDDEEENCGTEEDEKSHT